MLARALYRAVAVPGEPAPYDRAVLKIYYPAELSGSDWERNTGMVPAAEQAPCPVALFMPGANVSPEGFSWLSTYLAEQGIISVTYHFITEEIPDFVCLSPGIDISQLGKDHYLQKPCGRLIKPILDELAEVTHSGLLRGCMDLNKLFFVGHSAGGAAALYNNNPDWFPGLKGCITYGAHSGGSPQLGWPEGAVTPLDGRVPTLLLAGSADGVIAASGHRYGDAANNSCTARIEQTFNEAYAIDARVDYLVLDGANHFSFAGPYDGSTGRPFLEDQAARPAAEYQAYMRELIRNFMGRSLDDKQAGNTFNTLCQHPLVAEHQQKTQ